MILKKISELPNLWNLIAYLSGKWQLEVQLAAMILYVSIVDLLESQDMGPRSCVWRQGTVDNVLVGLVSSDAVFSNVQL